ncbi:TetR/AcrR family transcriptional regulator [Mycolicibacterium mengxianglii]|uniref:TetR/AcrR family transcriptional regulator n=1 Tax=Mycolicibacterium mengxianglii TaxID=2736649 RepID=UPI0018EEF687|nr:TetR/AcrR family transcriptional regulator [Mycolicibacterium mengxianglii]
MPETPRRSYAGQSAEERRRQRRARLLDTALDVLAANEWRTATVDKLCATAGLNKRYFYESFDNLDAVAAAAVDDVAADLRAATLAALAASADEPVERQALATAGAVVTTLLRDVRRAQVLLGGVVTSPALHQHRATVIRGLTSVLVAHARSVHGVALEKDPLAQVGPAFIVGGTADAILEYINGRVRVTADELAQGLATLWVIAGNGAAEVARTRNR